MPFLTREQIVSVKDLPYEDVEVPEWGGTVRVAGLSALDTMTFSQTVESLDEKKPRLVMTDLLVLTLVDEDFKPLFTQKDLERLNRKSARVIRRLFRVSQRLCGISEAPKAEEEGVKN